MPTAERIALVTGASRGLGRGIATALAASGANVVGVARTGTQLDELHSETASCRSARMPRIRRSPGS